MYRDASFPNMEMYHVESLLEELIAVLRNAHRRVKLADFGVEFGGLLGHDDGSAARDTRRPVGAIHQPLRYIKKLMYRARHITIHCACVWSEHYIDTSNNCCIVDAVSIQRYSAIHQI